MTASRRLFRTTEAGYVAMENLADPVQIGRGGPVWRQYDGGLDDLRLWRVARSAAEIQAAMATELSGLEAGLAAYWQFNEGTGPTAADAVSGGGLATLENGTLWMPGGPLGTAEPDTTPPDITGVVTSGLTDTSVVVGFQTSEPATAYVTYSVGASCPCVDVPSATLGTAHSVTLSGLVPDTLYQFVVHAEDAAGNPQTSVAYTVQTLPPAPDTQPPAVAIVQPLGGIVAGLVTIEATASDLSGVASVQVRVDGLDVGAPLTAPPYTLTWDSTTVADGAHTLTVEARDTLNNAATATVFVTVRNTPVVETPHFLEFDGIDDYLLAADADRYSFGTGTADSPFTLEMWFRPDAMGRHQLIGKWGESTNQEYKLSIISGGIRIDLRDQSAQAGAYAFSLVNFSSLVGAWHHLAVTYDGRGGATAADGLTLYVDGVAPPLFRTTEAGYVAMENLADPVQIGRGGPVWRQYDGGLDELRLWRVARSAAEIQATMATELSGLEPGLAAYWRFNEGTGGSAADAVNGGGLATLENGTLWMLGGPVVQ
ncbi:MAG: LamG-like jellyroll fold domain-containing protein [Vicinamibacterales bacterium]